LQPQPAASPGPSHTTAALARWRHPREAVGSLVNLARRQAGKLGKSQISKQTPPPTSFSSPLWNNWGSFGRTLGQHGTNQKAANQTPHS